MVITNIIHEDNLLRLGVRQALKDISDIQIMDEASTGKSGLLAAQKLSPHVVILGLKLEDIPVAEVVSQLLSIHPAPKLLLISLDPQQISSSNLFNIGILGYLTTHATPNDLLTAVKTVSSGKAFISDQILPYFKSINQTHSTPEQKLTAREIKILNLFAKGKNFAEIANLLSISHHTVHEYKNRILKKLNADNDVQLALIALKRGLISI